MEKIINGLIDNENWKVKVQVQAQQSSLSHSRLTPYPVCYCKAADKSPPSMKHIQNETYLDFHLALHEYKPTGRYHTPK